MLVNILSLIDLEFGKVRKKKKKKLFYCMVASVFVLGLATGCSSKKLDSTKGKDEEPAKEEKKGNCTIVECMKSIEITNSVEDIDNIIGFKGEPISEGSTTYVWRFTDTTKIEYKPSDGQGSISATIDRNTIKDKKVDFSKYSEIKELLNNGTSLTYDEFKEKVGGVEGTVVGKSSLSKRYTWVNAQGGYLTASFSEKTGKCTIVTGRY